MLESLSSLPLYRGMAMYSKYVRDLVFKKRAFNAANNLFSARSLDSFSKDVAILHSLNQRHFTKAPVRSFAVSCHTKNAAQKDLKCAEDAEQRINARGDFKNCGVSGKSFFSYRPRRALSIFPYWCNTFDGGVMHKTIYDGRDVIVQTRTGSEKMKFYIIPLVEKILKEHVSNSEGPKMLVLTPTNELADLVAGMIRSHSCELKVAPNETKSASDMGWIEQHLKRGVDILVGTPTVIAGYINLLDFSDLKRVVLHDVDRMLNMGFSHKIDCILNQTHGTDTKGENPQTLFFTATLPGWVRNMTKRCLSDYISINGLDLKNSIGGYIDDFNFENIFFKENMKDMRNFLENVSESNKMKFDELAKELMEKFDPIDILTTALAVAAGYEQKSLIDFKPGFVTLKFTSDFWVRNWIEASKLLPEVLRNKARNIRTCHDNKSFVFDVPMLLGNKYMESRKDDYDNDISCIGVLPRLCEPHFIHLTGSVI